MLKDCALAYAAAGLAVFPVTVFSIPSGKFKKDPLTAHGHLDRSCDPAQVAYWWTQWPEASIGACPADAGCVVVDLDVGWKDSQDTINWLAGLPVTRQARTPSRGEHCWFLSDCRFPNSKPCPFVDIRSDRGWVVLPPSPGYSWFVNIDPVPFPEEFARRLLQARAEKAEYEGGVDTPQRLARAALYLSNRAPAIEGNGGDKWTYDTACHLVRDIGLSADGAFISMIDWNERCSPPWSDDGLQTKIANACQHGGGTPNDMEFPETAIPSGFDFSRYASRGIAN